MATIGALRLEVHGINTRGSAQRVLPPIRTEAGRRRLCYRAVTVLNSCGLDLGTTHFKARLRQTLAPDMFLREQVEI